MGGAKVREERTQGIRRLQRLQSRSHGRAWHSQPRIVLFCLCLTVIWSLLHELVTNRSALTTTQQPQLDRNLTHNQGSSLLLPHMKTGLPKSSQHLGGSLYLHLVYQTAVCSSTNHRAIEEMGQRGEQRLGGRIEQAVSA